MTERAARAARTFTDEFKLQVVQLYLNGKPRVDFIDTVSPDPLDQPKPCNRIVQGGEQPERRIQTENLMYS